MNWERGQSGSDVSTLPPASYLAWCINLHLTAFRQHFLHFSEKGRDGVGPLDHCFYYHFKHGYKIHSQRTFYAT